MSAPGAEKGAGPPPGGVGRLEARLSPLERAQVAFVRRTLEPGPLDRALRWGQRQIGARWINASVSNLRQVHGLDRLPPLNPDESFLCVANHRSFFDLFVVSALLVSRGLPHRLLFPVRSAFFYDHPLGPLVNGAMSFFAMYPPLFRDPQRAPANLASLDEVARLLRAGGVFVGVHPEGTRKKDDDPYTFLPPQPGVGRLMFHSTAKVLPVFVNGLGNSIPKQVAGNVTRSGPPVFVVFGAPLDVDDLRARRPSPRVYRDLSVRALEAIGRLGAEERELRAAFGRQQPLK